MPRLSITLTGQPPQRYRFDLNRDHLTIGRAPDNDIVIDSPSVSARHCRIERREAGYAIQDQGSTNGLQIGERIVPSWVLTDGDQVKIGEAELSYHLSEEEITQLSPEPETEPSAPALDEPRAKEASEDSEHQKKSKFPFQALLVLTAVAAFYLGCHLRYQALEKKSGRSGEINLIQDLLSGRPARSQSD